MTYLDRTLRGDLVIYFLLCLSLMLNSCAQTDRMNSSPIGDADRVAYGTGALLFGGTKELTCGYGLYSYLLLGSPPNEFKPEAIIRRISAFLRFVPDIEDLELSHIPIRSLNVAYIPLVDATEQSEVDPAVFRAKGDSPKIAELARWFLKL